MKWFWHLPRKISWKFTLIYTAMFLLVLILLNGAVYFFLYEFVNTNIEDSIDNTLQFILPKLRGVDKFSFDQYEAEILQDISKSEGDIYFRIIDYNKEIIAQSNILRGIEMPYNQGFNQLKYNKQLFVYKTITITKFGFLNGYLQVVRDVTVEYNFLERLLMILLITGIIGGFGAILIGYVITRKTLKPISQMTDTARSISVSDLGNRLQINDADDELTNLARTFNSMLERLEQAFSRQQQFVSDASHELRTPISVIQGYIDLLDRWGKDEAEIRDEAIDAIKNEVQSMKSLMGSLLFLARGDSEKVDINKDYFLVNDLIDEIIKETQMITDEISVGGGFRGEFSYYGDRKLIKQLLRIFVDNSLKYTDSGGEVRIEGFRRKDKLILRISDTGCGIPEEDIPHIFERFYRVDKSRNAFQGGAGLGLSIARWIIDSHQGSVEIDSEVNVGTDITVYFPINLHE